MVLEKLFIADLQKVSGTAEKKLCALGVTKLITECPAMVTTYGDYWYTPYTFLSLNSESTQLFLILTYEF